MKINLLLIDNYDSFTYNLVQYLESLLGQSITVARNDELTLESVAQYDALILSPGPGLPSQAGILMDILNRYADKMPILGVCLGHQAIAERFGGKLINLNEVYHGIDSEIEVIRTDDQLFHNLPARLTVGRYHSWVIDSGSFPKQLRVTARDESGQIMALRHKVYPVFGVQFHPESIMTPDGKVMLANFLELVREDLVYRAEIASDSIA